MSKARGPGVTYQRKGLDQPPVHTVGNGAAMPAVRPSTEIRTSRYGPSVALQEYGAASGTVRYQYSSQPPPDPVAYTSARMRSVLRGVVRPVESSGSTRSGVFAAGFTVPRAVKKVRVTRTSMTPVYVSFTTLPMSISTGWGRPRVSR